MGDLGQVERQPRTAQRSAHHAQKRASRVFSATPCRSPKSLPCIAVIEIGPSLHDTVTGSSGTFTCLRSLFAAPRRRTPCPRDPAPARAGRKSPLLPSQENPPQTPQVTATQLERREIPSFSESREARIAEAAYWRAERRGFTAGQELDDWLAAEKEVDDDIATKRARLRPGLKSAPSVLHGDVRPSVADDSAA